jgi:uncharacterized protein
VDRPDLQTRPERRTQGPVQSGAAALARILAFCALMLGLMYAFGAAWSLLAAPATGDLLYAGNAVIAAAALVAGAILIRGVDGRPAAALGVGLSGETARHVAVGTAIGAVALTAAVLALLASGSLRYAAAPGTAGEWTAVIATHGAIFAVSALAEEAMFRGYPFQVLARAAGPAVATVVSSALFAALHLGNPGIGAFALVNIFLAGVLLAVAYLRTLSLWFATAVHLGWNWATASFFDLPVSGIEGFETPLYEPALRGADWWTGGAFGPEGGFVGTIGFAVALLLVLRLGWIRPDPRIAEAGALVRDRERETG